MAEVIALFGGNRTQGPDNVGPEIEVDQQRQLGAAIQRLAGVQVETTVINGRFERTVMMSEAAYRPNPDMIVHAKSTGGEHELKVTTRATRGQDVVVTDEKFRVSDDQSPYYEKVERSPDESVEDVVARVDAKKSYDLDTLIDDLLSEDEIDVSPGPKTRLDDRRLLTATGYVALCDIGLPGNRIPVPDPTWLPFQNR